MAHTQYAGAILIPGHYSGMRQLFDSILG